MDTMACTMKVPPSSLAPGSPPQMILTPSHAFPAGAQAFSGGKIPSRSTNSPVLNTERMESNRDEVDELVDASLARGPIAYKQDRCPNDRCSLNFHGARVGICPGSWMFK